MFKQFNALRLAGGRPTRQFAALAVLCLVLLALGASAETYNFDGCWGQAGFNLQQQDASGVEVIFSVPTLKIKDIQINGEAMKSLAVPGIFLPNDAGAPDLPGTGRYLALPQGAGARLEIVDFRTEVFHNLSIAPAMEIPLDTDPVIRYHKDPAIYNADANYPAQPVRLSEKTDLRGVDVVILGVTPFQYNPVTRDLTVYKDIRIRVNFQGGSNHFGDDRLRSPWWDPLLEEHLLNYSSLPAVNYNQRVHNPCDETNVEYLIIVPDDPVFLAWADTLKHWRNEQGIITGITTLTEIGGNDATLIKNYITNAYQHWSIPPVAVLLLSDYQSTGQDVYGITSPIYNSYCVSDNMYADINNNNLPELTIARISAQNGAQLQTIIGKMLGYERTPYTDPNFYAHPLIAGGWQSDRWFILCTEVIYGFMQNSLGKAPTRQYAGSSGPPSSWSTNPNTSQVVTYFGPSGLNYIPATPSHLTNWTGSATGINAAINAGAFLVQHRDHGEEIGWSSPAYYVSNLPGLTNTELPYIMSTNCLTGKFNWTSTCFSEAFTRMEHGCLGITAASEVSYSFVNDAFVWGVYDCMWPQFDPNYGNPPNVQNNLRPGFANASGKYYLQASSWPYNPGDKTVTYHLMHSFGDAFLTIFSEVPQNLTVSHLPQLYTGMTSFSVTANDGSWIGLSVDGVCVGHAAGTGSPVNLTIPMQTPGHNLRVTVTKANYYRYTADVPIVPAAGPYVVFNGCQINDAGVGNNNGQWDFGETTNLNLRLKNVGVSVASNVNATIRSTDSYANITDSTQAYGNINPGDSVMVNAGFQVHAAINTPDQHIVPFTVTATSGTSSWQSPFSLIVNAPIIVKDTLRILDSGGNNNGQLDPGENTTFALTMGNHGHLAAQNVSVALTCNNAQITITGSPVNYGTINAGASVNGNYTVVAASSVPQGTLVTFTLNVTATGGYTNSQTFDLVVGDVRYQPSGPDSYGYRAYDNLDGGPAHPYNWIEVAPQKGGPGTALTFSSPDDGTAQVPLPFTFRYYGQNYTNIAVCTNGWLAPGNTTVTTYTPTGLPNTGAPPNIVAAYWRDLYMGTGAQIAYYYNSAAHYFVVEWDSVYYYNTATLRIGFEAVLYDPAFYPTPTNDGAVLVQYKGIQDLATACFGIANQTQTIGLQYGFNNAWNTNAWPVVVGRTITYTTATTAVIPNVDITLTPQTPPIVIPAVGGSFNFTILVANNGTTPAIFDVWIMQQIPGGAWQGPMLGPVNLTVPGGVTPNRLRTQNVPGTAPAGTYTYRGYVGLYSATRWDSSSFTYTKSTTGDGPGMGDWRNYGESFAPFENGSSTVDQIPSAYSLNQNWPNPFNPATTIRFALPNSGLVTVAVYDLQGRMVAQLVNGWRAAGTHEVTFDGSRLASGLYFCRLQAGDFTSVKKMMLIK